MTVCGGVNLEQVINISPIVTMVWNSGKNEAPCFVSEAVAAFGYSPADFTSGRLAYAAIIHPDDRPGLEFVPDCSFKTYRIACYDKSWRWVSHRICALDPNEGFASGHLWTIVDVTGAKEAEDSLKKSEQELQALLNAIPAVLMVVGENGEILNVSGSRETPLAGEASRYIGKNIEESLFREKSGTIMEPVRRCLETGIPQFFTFDTELAGRVYFQEARVSLFSASPDRAGRAAILAVLDITSKKELSDEIRLQAGHDPLDSPSNRGRFNRKLLISLAEAHRTGTSLALFMIDPDKFNKVNEAIGRDMADLLLKGLAGKIKGACRKDDILYRMEGVNFYLILPGLRDREEVPAVAGRIINAVRAAPAGFSGDFSLTATIGISLFPENGRDGKTLLRAAELALSSGKAEGGDRFVFAPAPEA